MFSNELSCEVNNTETTLYIKYGDILTIEIYINACPRSGCKRDSCLQQCLIEIQSEIRSKFGLTAFSFIIETANGAILSVPALFCSFGHVAPGKK